MRDPLGRTPSVCHKCKYYGKHDAACITCTWDGAPSHAGKRFVSLDAAARPETIYAGRIDPLYEGKPRSGRTLRNHSEQTTVWLAGFLAEIAKLEDIEIATLYAFIHGLPASETAARMKTPARRIAGTLRHILQQMPHLRTVIDTARQGGLADFMQTLHRENRCKAGKYRAQIALFMAPPKAH